MKVQETKRTVTSVFPLTFKYPKRQQERIENSTNRRTPWIPLLICQLTAAIQIMPVPYWLITVVNILLTPYSYLMKCHTFRGRVTLK